MPCTNTITKYPLNILETTQMETTQVYDYDIANIPEVLNLSKKIKN